MTREEAIRILDPETSRDALWKYEDKEDRLKVVNEACRVAVAALRAQQDAPLTLEELREMDGEPAYFVNIVAPDYSFWGIVMVDNIFGVKKISTEGKTFCVHQEFLTDQSYGKFWLAYRRKPEEGN